jgi:hypothetical protein
MYNLFACILAGELRFFIQTPFYIQWGFRKNVLLLSTSGFSLKTQQKFAADPVIYIPDETIYVSENGLAEIRAVVYSSSDSITVAWYHEGLRINAATDTRYSVSAQGLTVHILTVTRVETALLGRYEAVVTAGGKNRSDTVQLAFFGEKRHPVRSRS